MNIVKVPKLRAIRDYKNVQREAIHAVEREAVTREPQPPEPCNFCAPDDHTDIFDEMKIVLGRWWWAWLIAFTGLCVVSAFAAVMLVAEMAMP